MSSSSLSLLLHLSAGPGPALPLPSHMMPPLLISLSSRSPHAHLRSQHHPYDHHLHQDLAQRRLICRIASPPPPPPPPAPRVIPPSPPPSTTKQKQPQQNLSPAKASAKATKAVAVASTSSKRKTPSDDDMCAAIRANDALYERILLLEAPHMSEFEVTIKEAGLAVPRTALVAFLERQGVPVANTGNRNRATPTKRRRRR
mmetsp:Transcript_7328/g.19014  ORF Transcript_7328/g.19014 Transcript_7328/m.19014 type:complete len:201 (-) Transcript_7328:11-613(-)